jgi:cytochrome o ubiquinol oxidase subunit 2
MNTQKKMQTAAIATPGLVLSGCGSEWRLLDPAGPIAHEIMWLMIISGVIMLLVVVPVTLMGFVFPWRYRKRAASAGSDSHQLTNPGKSAAYEPYWEHSGKIEAVVWGIPIAIIMVLGYLTYTSSHALDPRRPIESDKPTMIVQVVALQWKWLFIYPEEGIASVNEMAMPVDQPVQFLITSDGPMNSFFIPNLGSQIYAMSGMENRLHLMADRPGVYDGFSANYSGYGHSGMKFKAHAMATAAEFDDWVRKVKTSGESLDDAVYESLRQKSRDVAPMHFALGDALLFSDVIDRYSGSLGQISKQRIKPKDQQSAMLNEVP